MRKLAAAVRFWLWKRRKPVIIELQEGGVLSNAVIRGRVLVVPPAVRFEIRNNVFEP